MTQKDLRSRVWDLIFKIEEYSVRAIREQDSGMNINWLSDTRIKYVKEITKLVNKQVTDLQEECDHDFIDAGGEDNQSLHCVRCGVKG